MWRSRGSLSQPRSKECVLMKVNPGRSPVRRATPVSAYRTRLGRMYLGETERLLQTATFRRLRGSVQLLLTSPPFPLNRKKAYGNLTGDSYLSWLESYGQSFADLLTEDGSIVMEVG